jgi:pSer/pThr/pTyr-binding forkhead associated (FHA) protein
MSSHLHVRASGREAIFGTGLHEITVGSARGCAVRFTEAAVAPEHLVLRSVDGGWILQTLASDCRVYRDGQPIDSIAIDAPLELRLGDPRSGPLLEVAPAVSELRDLTVDFGSGPAAAQAESVAPAISFALSGDALRIGRDPESDVVVDDVLVSRRHAEIRKLGEQRYEAIDLGSHNGTFVNGRRIDRALLDELDVVSIGRNSYRLTGERLEEYVDTGEVAYAALALTVRLADGTKLLDRASFSLESRSMLGVVGPSGSGKSTLLRSSRPTSAFPPMSRRPSVVVAWHR